MQYPYRTTISWVLLTPESVEIINAKIAQLQDENKTDGLLTWSNDLRQRHWASLEDAQAWIDWLETLPGTTLGETKQISEV